VKRWLLAMLGGVSYEDVEMTIITHNAACRRFAANMELARRSGQPVIVLLQGERAPADTPPTAEIFVCGTYCRLPRYGKIFIAPWASMWSFRP
jgi:hypothetical protein